MVSARDPTTCRKLERGSRSFTPASFERLPPRGPLEPFQEIITSGVVHLILQLQDWEEETLVRSDSRSSRQAIRDRNRLPIDNPGRPLICVEPRWLRVCPIKASLSMRGLLSYDQHI